MKRRPVIKYLLVFNGPLAQLVRAPGSYPDGPQFESVRGHKINIIFQWTKNKNLNWLVKYGPICMSRRNSMSRCADFVTNWISIIQKRNPKNCLGMTFLVLKIIRTFLFLSLIISIFVLWVRNSIGSGHLLSAFVSFSHG